MHMPILLCLGIAGADFGLDENDLRNIILNKKTEK
jgi:hypothetical protein